MTTSAVSDPSVNYLIPTADGMIVFGGYNHQTMSPVTGPGFVELFGALPVAVLVIDPDGRIVHANAACESLLNHSEKSMIGQPYDAVLLPPEDYADRRDGHGFAALTLLAAIAPDGVQLFLQAVDARDDAG